MTVALAPGASGALSVTGSDARSEPSEPANVTATVGAAEATSPRLVTVSNAFAVPPGAGTTGWTAAAIDRSAT